MREYIKDIVTNFKANTLQEADRLLKLHYETVFKIRDHKADFLSTKMAPDPASFHLGRSAGGYEILSKSLVNYEKYRVHEILKISFFEYLEFTKPMLGELHRTCLALGEARDKAENQKNKARNEQLELYLKQQATGGGNTNPSTLNMGKPQG